MSHTSFRSVLSWKSAALGALGVANAALLLSLFTGGRGASSSGFDLSQVDPAAIFPATPAHAQGAQQDQTQAAQARVGDYIMIPTRLTGGNQEIVYIFDTESARVSAAAYDQQNLLTFIQAVPVGR